MDKHRIRMTNLPDDPIPVLWIEFEKDSWIDVSINLTPEDNLHDLIHSELCPKFEFEINKPIRICYHTQTFDIYSQLSDYKESIIE